MNHSQLEPTSSIRLLPVIVFAAAIAQIFASQFSRITGLGVPIEDLPQPYISPEEPEGYAFVIWAVIFALALAYSAKQAFPRSSHEMLFRTIRPASALLFGLSSAWMISAQLWGNGFNLVVIIVTMLVASISLLKTVSETPGTTAFHQRVIDPLFGLFAGWLTLAVFLNAGSAVRGYIRNDGIVTRRIRSGGFIASRAVGFSRHDMDARELVVFGRRHLGTCRSHCDEHPHDRIGGDYCPLRGPLLGCLDMHRLGAQAG
jgi:hypothetical protein